MIHSEEQDQPSSHVTPRSVRSIDLSPQFTAPVAPRPPIHDEDRVLHTMTPIDRLRLPDLGTSSDCYALPSFKLRPRRGPSDIDEVLFR